MSDNACCCSVEATIQSKSPARRGGDGESGGSVDRILIIDIVADGDEAEPEGFEEGWGADIDAVACTPQTTGTGGTDGGNGGMAGSGVDDGGGNGGSCECNLQSGNIVGDGLVWLVVAGLWLGYRRTRR